MADWIPQELNRILAETEALQRAYLVGGCVRDMLLGLSIKDFDIEVFGQTYDSLNTALSRWGRADLVGRSFGVIKLTTPAGHTYDFAVPRRDAKVTSGHKGFTVSFDPGISLEQAAARRDFTINSILYDPRQDQFLDFFGGRADLHNRVLRHTSPAFAEDPLRVLRGMQFAARFDLRPVPETIELCRGIKDAHRELALERIREEWFKWAARSIRPSAGLRFLADTGWIEHYPELHALQNTPQDPEWHPEGDVFTHTCHCCDALVELPDWQAADETSRIVYSLAVLTHDFAKPQTTQTALKDGILRLVSPGHDEAGGPVAERFLERINAPLTIRQRVIPLVTNHLAHLNESTDRAVRRLARRLEPENIHGLCIVINADQFGRPPRPRVVSPRLQQLKDKAAQLQLQACAPKPLLLGRHLVGAGMKPGKEIGRIVELTFEAQLEGHFQTLSQACAWLARQEDLGLPPDVRRNLASPQDQPPPG